jgi:hypothetical protein
MRSLVVMIALFAVTAPLAGTVGAWGLGPATDGAADETADVTITVRVVDDQDNGIGDATVTVSWDGGNRTRTTVNDGRVLVSVPTDEELEIRVEHPDYVQNIPDTVRNVEEGQEVVVDMTPPSTETVTVVDGDGDPVEGARVSLIKIGQIRTVAGGMTGADGTFVADRIEEGEYQIRVSEPGYDRARVNVDVAGDSNHTVTIEENSTEVRFRIADGRVGDGLAANVRVLIDGEEYLSFRTGDSGNAERLLPVNTRYTVVVNREGYDEVRESFSVTQNSRSIAVSINRTDNLSLSVGTTQVLAGNTLEVEVTDEYGELVEGATIRVDGEAVATTDADGSATVRLSEPGSHEVVADDGTVQTDPVIVRAVEAATSTAPPTTTREPTTAPPTATPEPTTAPPTPTATATATDESTATATATATDDDGGGGGAPGFAAGAAVAALLIALLTLRRRR